VQYTKPQTGRRVLRYSGGPNLYKYVSCVLAHITYRQVPSHGDPPLLLSDGYPLWRLPGLNTYNAPKHEDVHDFVLGAS
jgi:hypothetical protein